MEKRVLWELVCPPAGLIQPGRTSKSRIQLITTSKNVYEVHLVNYFLIDGELKPAPACVFTLSDFEKYLDVIFNMSCELIPEPHHSTLAKVKEDDEDRTFHIQRLLNPHRTKLQLVNLYIHKGQYISKDMPFSVHPATCLFQMAETDWFGLKRNKDYIRYS